MTAGPRRISVVLPVLDEERHIGEVLGSLLEQEFPEDMFEIVVVDGGSTDKTAEVVSRFATAHSNVTLLHNEKKLSSAGRNAGARAAKGDVVLFIDGHCEVPGRLLLASAARLFAETGADVLCRPQPLDVPAEPGTRATRVQRAIALARSSWLGHNPSSVIFATKKEGFVDPESSGAAYTRKVFERIGGFDETFDACEDVDFNLRAKKAGLRAYTSPALTVRYVARENLRSLFRQMMRYGRGRARLVMKHRLDAARSALLLGLPPLLAALLVALSFFSRRALLLLVLAASGYVAALIVTALILSSRRDARLFSSLALVFLTLHAGLFAGFWEGLFRGRQSSAARLARTHDKR
ncbi:MAG: glycosyltransferase family 2 protein [Candidatus Eisenbacteria bacterium]